MPLLTNSYVLTGCKKILIHLSTHTFKTMPLNKKGPFGIPEKASRYLNNIAFTHCYYLQFLLSGRVR